MLTDEEFGAPQRRIFDDLTLRSQRHRQLERQDIRALDTSTCPEKTTSQSRLRLLTAVVANMCVNPPRSGRVLRPVDRLQARPAAIG